MNLIEYKKFEPIYVIGHEHSDVDSIVSSKIMCDIFNDSGIKSYYAILDSDYEIDDYNKSLIDECMNYNPVVIKRKDINKYNWFLVDHNDISQSLKTSTNVIGCLDHHINSNQIKNVMLSDVCANALFIYDIFKSEYDFSNEQKYQIFIAFLCDSTYGKSSKYRLEDGKLADELGFGHDYEKYFKKFFKTTDLSKGVKEALYTSYKKYVFDKIEFESSSISSYGTKGLYEYKSLISNINSFLGIWKDYKSNKTYVFFNYKNKLKEFKYNFIASRATTILNDVLKYIKEGDIDE